MALEKLEFISPFYELTKEDRVAIRYLEKHLPKKYANEPFYVDTDRKMIKVANQTYYFKVSIYEDKANVIMTRRFVRNGKVMQVLIGEELKYSKKRLLKSKKGKAVFSNSTKLILSLGALVMLISAGNKVKTESISPDLEVPSFEFESETVTEIEVLEDIFPDIVIEEDLLETKKLDINDVTVQGTIIITNNTRYEKRQETDNLFGNYIGYYSMRNGLDYRFVSCLLSQERSDNEKDVKNYCQNIGQLTSAICDEKIEAPVFANNEVIDFDKIYVLPSFYDNYPLEDLETMTTFPKFRESEQEIVKKAVSLKKAGYQIFRKTDVITNVKLNIKVSCAYLSYVINKKQDLIRGAMSYNAGYPSVPNNCSYEDIFTGKISVDDPYYIGHIMQYAYEEECREGFVIHYQDGSSIRYKIRALEKEENYEKENGYHL